jgi:hypothetical protein
MVEKLRFRLTKLEFWIRIVGRIGPKSIDVDGCGPNLGVGIVQDVIRWRRDWVETWRDAYVVSEVNGTRQLRSSGGWEGVKGVSQW